MQDVFCSNHLLFMTIWILRISLWIYIFLTNVSYIFPMQTQKIIFLASQGADMWFRFCLFLESMWNLFGWELLENRGKHGAFIFLEPMAVEWCSGPVFFITIRVTAPVVDSFTVWCRMLLPEAQLSTFPRSLWVYLLIATPLFNLWIMLSAAKTWINT